MHAIILRKLNINEKDYYQLLDTVEGKEISDGYIRVLKGNKFVGEDISSIDNHDTEICYLEIDEELSERFNTLESEFFKYDEDGDFVNVSDVVEKNDVIISFYDKFKDFKLIPDYDLDSFIDALELNMKKNVLGQDEVIKKIIAKIYNNQMYFKTDLEIPEMKKNKSNILIAGPFGSGKTTLKDAMLEVSSKIPIVEATLSDSLSLDAAKIVNSLLNAAHGNVYLAQRGIVIIDGINPAACKYSKDDDDFENLSLKSLEILAESRSLSFPVKDDRIFTFDFSLLTFICLIDINHEEEVDIDDSYYGKMSLDDFDDLGITDELLFNCFDNEVIYMNEVDYELAYNILKDKKLSPIYQYKKMLEANGKTLKISKDFIDVLIKRGLEAEEGFTGILRFFKYVIASKGRTQKEIVLDSRDVKKLRIGTCGVDTDLDDERDFKDIKVSSEKDGLDVDLEKRTINGLTVKEAVSIITKEIKGQDEHVFRIVNAFYNHTLNRYKGFSEDEFRKLKQNIFLIASTGVGKTAIFEALARLFKLPFKRDSINSYTASGYVGRSVDDLVTGLIASAHGDLSKAQFGILGLDEFDKLARDNHGIGFGNKVQEELLTLIEGDVRDIQTDMSGRTLKFNTEYLFIILMGACQDINQVIEARTKSARKLGFNGNDTKISHEITREDLIAYGFEEQVLARIPNIIRLNDLTKDTLLEIIKSEMGYVSLIKKSYSKSGIEINMTDKFMDSLANGALNLKVGARGIRQLFERIVVEIDKNIQDGNIKEVIIGDNALTDFGDITYIEKAKVKKL